MPDDLDEDEEEKPRGTDLAVWLSILTAVIASVAWFFS
jgi:hypothetical protein